MVPTIDFEALPDTVQLIWLTYMEMFSDTPEEEEGRVYVQGDSIVIAYEIHDPVGDYAGHTFIITALEPTMMKPAV